MCVYDFGQLDSTAVSLFFQDRKNPMVKSGRNYSVKGVRRTLAGWQGR